MGWLVKIYNDLKKDFPIFIYLYMRVKKEGLNKQDISVLLKSQQDLNLWSAELICRSTLSEDNNCKSSN